MSELKSFQLNLNNDKESKQQFVDGYVDSEEDESINDSSEEDQIKIVAPRRKGGKNVLEKMLIDQSIKQQTAYLKAQKTIYKLRAEIDTEEIKTRYLKLDLNNTQVKLEEEISKNNQMKNVNLENWSLKILMFLYVLWSIIYKIY